MSLRLTFAILLSTWMLGCSDSPSTKLPSSPSTPPIATTPIANVTIVNGASNMTTTAYTPNPVNVLIGTTITWINIDNTTHTSTFTGNGSTANNGGWDSGPIAPGGQFRRTFQTAGTFQYFCTIHPGMVGTVNVQ